MRLRTATGKSRRGRKDRSDRMPYLGSALIHFAAIALLLATSVVQPAPIQFEVFEMELVAAPAPSEEPDDPAPAPEELQVETPDQQSPEPEVEEVPPPEPDPEPEVEEPEPDPVEDPPEDTPPPTPVAESEEAESVDEAESDAEITVRMEGLRRDYPQYYRNITTQIRRCFRPPAGGYEAQVYFVIRRDGSVRDIELRTRSGNARYDIESVSAVECAARDNRFGPLPEDLSYDQLPVLFNFRSAG